MRALLTLAAIAMTTAAADKRAMTLDDLFAFKRVADPQISPDGTQVVYEVTEITDVATNKKHTHLWIAATDGKSPPRQLTSSGKADKHPRWSPDGGKILFESNRSGNNQLWLLGLKAGGEAVQLTTISTEAGNAIWSRDGAYVAFVSAVYPEFSELPFGESDKKNKEKIDAIEANPVKAKTFTKLFYRHWDEYVGDKRQHIFVLQQHYQAHESPASMMPKWEPRDVTPGDRDAFPTSDTFSSGDNFTFTPDSKHIVFTAVPKRDEAWSTNYDLCRVGIENKSKDWETFTVDNKAADTSPCFSPDGKKLAWRAQKKAGYEADKWDILVADCNTDGTFKGTTTNRTTSEDSSVNEFVWSYQGDILFGADWHGTNHAFMAKADGSVSRGIQVAKGGMASGYRGSKNNFSVTPDGLSYSFLVFDMTKPPEVFTQNFSGPKSWNGIETEHNKHLLDQLERAKPEFVKVQVEDAQMHMWILQPPGFDSSKKYPLVYLIHGGPQGAWEDGWSYRWNPQLWAAQGYVVVMPNPRGSTGFGQKFVDEITGDWGGKCYRDLVAGLEHLKKLDYIDKDRMATAGASFGGYMQMWFAVNDIAKNFKCQIAHDGVWNFESMWGTTDELWFDEWEHGGLPWEKPGKYRVFSPHIRAGELGKNKVPMLIIHNDLDFRCPIGQGHEFFSALQRQGVPSRFVNFPDEGHWVLKPANSKHWHTEVFSWLKQYCPPGGK